MKNNIKHLVGTGVVGLLMVIAWYIFLPAFNVRSLGFWVFILAGLCAIGALNDVISDEKSVMEKFGMSMWVLALLGLFIILGGMFLNTKVFKSESYANLIEVEEKVFSEDFVESDLENIPLMDRDTATRLGERQLGGVSELVSQFVASDEYVQVNIEDSPYRVSPLEYASFFRWLNNKEDGIPGYMKIDMQDGNVELVDLEENIKYSNSEYFTRDVKRYLRFNYPSTIFGEPSFETDDYGHPYYVATTYDSKMFFKVKEPNGVIVLDAVTGETEEFELENSPKWIDRVYSADLILKQLDYNGSLKNGYLNSLFGKKGVTRTTDGYNYLSINEDIYLYTGVTSANTDASNIGFYLVNMRTKDANFYPVVSADEYSAMESAEGSVQQMQYESTFPILINLEGRPYYLSSLKDDGGLVRLYALTDAQDYQDVITGKTIEEIINQLNVDNVTVEETENIQEIESKEELIDFEGQVENISEAVVSGNTIYYFMINGEVYKANIDLHDQLPFVGTGTTLEGKIDSKNNFKEIIINQ